MVHGKYDKTTPIKLLQNKERATLPKANQLTAIYTEDNNVVLITVYGKKSIQSGYLFNIEGNLSINTLQNIMHKQIKYNIFFVVKNNCWHSQILQLDRLFSIAIENLTIITGDMPIDLIHLSENEINSILYKKNITLIINKTGELIHENRYNHQKCTLVTIDNDNSLNNSLNNNNKNIKNAIQQMWLKKDFVNTDFLANYNNNTYKNVQKEKQLKHLHISKQYKSMHANCKLRTTKIKIFKSTNTIVVPDYGISNIDIEILSKYFNIYIYPLINTTKHVNVPVLQNADKLPFNGIVLPSSLINMSSINEQAKDKIISLISTNKPILTLGFGSCILANIMNFILKTNNSNAIIDNYQLYDNYNNIYHASMLIYRYFDRVPHNFHTIFYDQNNHNVVGIENDKILSLTFDCLSKNIYTTRILDMFDSKMNANNRQK